MHWEKYDQKANKKRGKREEKIIMVVKKEN